jgi:hypothetical protein
MFWAWAWSIQIGTWRRPEGSRSGTIGLRLAASRAMPADAHLDHGLAAGRFCPIMASCWTRSTAAMFTGLVQAVGTAAAHRARRRGAAGSTPASALDPAQWQLGDSVAVDGVCLTVTSPGPAGASGADVSEETLARSTLAREGPTAAAG